MPSASAPAPVESAAPPTDAAPPERAVASAEAEADAAPPAPQAEAQAGGHELDGFYAALRGLEKKTRSEHVRVTWLGDSHGAADFWSGTLRTALQKRFGSGGVGFVNVGSKSYRHDAVTMDIKGKWKLSPKGPSTTLVTGDGVFGLSGMLFSGAEDNPHATLTVTEAPPLASPSWDLCYRLRGKADEILVKLPGMKDRTLRVSASEPPGPLRHVRLEGNGEPALSVTPTAGDPQLCGVVMESDPKVQPGVVLDTLGINGARLATPLAWKPPSRPPTGWPRPRWRVRGSRSHAWAVSSRARRAASTFCGVMGRSVMRTPTASYTALAMAGAPGSMAVSLAPLAP